MKRGLGQLLIQRNRELGGITTHDALGWCLQRELAYIRSQSDRTVFSQAMEFCSRIRLIRQTTRQWAKAKREETNRVLLASLPQAELQVRLHEEMLVRLLPQPWQRVLYRAFLAMDELPTVDEAGATQLRFRAASGLATVLCGAFLLWATLYILAFHLRQVWTCVTVKARRM